MLKTQAISGVAMINNAVPNFALLWAYGSSVSVDLVAPVVVRCLLWASCFSHWFSWKSERSVGSQNRTEEDYCNDLRGGWGVCGRGVVPC